MAKIPVIPSGSGQDNLFVLSPCPAGISFTRDRSVGDAPENSHGTVLKRKRRCRPPCFCQVYSGSGPVSPLHAPVRESVCTGSTGFPIRKRELHRWAVCCSVFCRCMSAGWPVSASFWHTVLPSPQPPSSFFSCSWYQSFQVSSMLNGPLIGIELAHCLTWVLIEFNFGTKFLRLVRHSCTLCLLWTLHARSDSQITKELITNSVPVMYSQTDEIKQAWGTFYKWYANVYSIKFMYRNDWDYFVIIFLYD